MKKNRRKRSLGRFVLPEGFWLCSIILLLGSMDSLSVKAQGKEELVSVSVKQMPVIDIFKVLEKQVHYQFMYHDSDILKLGKKDVHVKNVPLSVALDSCLKGSAVGYEFVGEQVIFKRVESRGVTKSRKITGVVVDERGEPLPGASIVITGLNMGVTTDKNGAFTIELPKEGNHSLTVSFLGFKKMVQEVKDERPLRIVLQEDAAKIEEVVVTGYQRINRKLSAASTYTVRAEDVMIPGKTTLDDMLQGEIPGLMVMNTSGSPLAIPKMRMRGTSTLLGNAAPVWVIDGVIKEDPVSTTNEDVAAIVADGNFAAFGNAIAGLNPMDIESITFLKDAAATSIYGTRAANGVIVVTTKKGNAGKTRLSYSGTLSITERPSYKKSVNMMNSQERMNLSKEFFDDGLLFKVMPKYGFERMMLDYLENKIPYSDVEKEYLERESLNTDWFDLLFSNAISHSHSLSVSGGSDKTTYYLSLSYSDDQSVADGENVKRYTVGSRVNTQFTPWLRGDWKLNYSERKVRTFYTVDPMSYAINTSRALRPDEFYVRGTASQSGKVDDVSYKFEHDITFNIFNELENTSDRASTKSFDGSLRLNARFFEGLSGEFLFAYSSVRAINEKAAYEGSYYMSNKRGYDLGDVASGSINEKLSVFPFGGYYYNNSQENVKWESRITLEYNKIWNEKHHLTGLAGLQLSSMKRYGLKTTEHGYFPDRGKTIYYEYDKDNAGFLGDRYQTSNYKHTAVLTDRVENSRKILASLIYSYDDRYVLNGSFSVDATNRFGQNKKYRFSPVWSVSGRWNVTEENWMKQQEVMNLLSFKASYGSQGNVVPAVSPDLVAEYPASSPVDPYTGEYILYVKSLPYPDLQWEKTMSMSIGAEIGMWDNRFTMLLEYYKKWGSRIIYTLDVPMEFGITNSYINGADMNNTGFELSFSVVPVRTSKVRWSISPNFSISHNKVRRKMVSDSYTKYLSGIVTRDDYPVGAFWSWNFTGLNSETGYPEYDFGDISGYSSAELKSDPSKFLTYSGRRNPIVSGGLSTSLSLFNFSVRASFAFNLGAKKRLRAVYSSNAVSNGPAYYENLPSEFVTHWRKTGDEKITNKPGFMRSNSGYSPYYYTTPVGSVNMYSMWDQSEQRVVNADFLRCRTLSLGYTVPAEFLSKMKVRGLSFNLNVNNPFVIKNYKLKKQDPETGSSSIPLLPSYNFSINISL